MLSDMLKRHDEIFADCEFDMTEWGDRRRCGTAACALGSAGFYPPFRELGLITKTRPYGRVEYGDRGCYGAGEDFFGITHQESWHLFSTCSYDKPEEVTPKQVASRVDRIIRKYDKQAANG